MTQPRTDPPANPATHPAPSRGGAQVQLAVNEDGIATVMLCDRGGKNELSEEVVHELLATLETLAQSTTAKVAVFVGYPEVFCAGASKEMLQAILTHKVAPTDILLSKSVLDLPIPTIAAMEGHAIGGGLALGLCADLIVMAKESRYGCSFMNMGFTPGMGVTAILEHVLSRAMAHELMYTGQPLRGHHFEGKSGINYVLPRSNVRAKAFELAERIAEKPRTSLETLKRVLSLPRRQAFESTRTLESMMHKISFDDPEVRKLIEENYV